MQRLHWAAALLALGVTACGGSNGGSQTSVDAETTDRGVGPVPDASGGADATSGADAAGGTAGGADASGGAPNNDAGPRFACADGVDNDDDGLVDLADPGCVGPEDNDEADAAAPQCADGADNDGDGAPDLADVNCTSESDPTEGGEGAATACTNEVDDDADGLIDFPLDPGCRAAGDESEDSDAQGETPTCANGEDDDADGQTDYPADPGCQGRGDMNEADPTPQFACSNGADDDADGQIDFPGDPGCAAAGDATEFGACGPALDAIDLNAALAASGAYEGTLVGADAQLTGTCGGGSGPELVFQYRLEARVASLTFSTDHAETTAPTVLYVRTACEDAQDVACNRGSMAAPGTTARLERPTPGLYFVVVDTGNAAIGPGAFRLTVESTPAPACDDGVDNDADGQTDLFDRGCVGTDDADEMDEGDPACGNGLDDDGDGQTDYPADVDCVAAGGLLEGPVCDPGFVVTSLDALGGEVPVMLGAGASVTSTGCGLGIGQESVVAVTVDEASRVRISVTPLDEGDLIASVRSGCSDPATEVACDNSIFGNVLDFEVETDGAETVYVLVEADDQGFFGPSAAAAVRVTVEPLVTACSDGVDNDDDAAIDRNDPGCESSKDDSEADPAVRPACADGQDNDADGRTDYPADDGCAAAGDLDEAISCDFVDALTVIPDAGGEVDLDFTADVYDASCAGRGSDAVVAFVVSEPSSVVVSTTGGDFDTVLAVLTACEDNAEVACDDDSGEGTLSLVAFDRLDPGVYFAAVEPFGGAPGTARLSVVITPLATNLCDDQLDNDGDGAVDLSDPGCFSALDSSEDDPAEAPACANGVDDDADGQTDFPADPECMAAGSPTEAGRCEDGRAVIEVGQAGGRFPVDFSNAADLTLLSCQRVGVEVPFALTLTERSRVRAATTTRLGDALGAALSVRTGCGEVDVPDEELACGGPFDGGLSVRELLPGTYYLFAEVAAGAVDAGFVEVTVDSLVRACNDGVDNDADGRVDAADPGCALGADNDEADPASPPACADGIDNDADGQTDYPSDDACLYAGGAVEAPRCGEVPTVEAGAGGEIELSFADALELGTPSCNFGDGPDVLVAVEVERVSDLSAEATSRAGSPDFSLSLLDACPASGEVRACTRTGSGPLQARRLAPGTYFLHVQRDEFLAEDDAVLTLTLTPVNAACDDALDNDADGAVDALDPGCESAVDSDEVDPLTPAACGDGLDNDADGRTDFPADVHCAAVGGAREEARCPAGTSVVEVDGPGVFVADLSLGAHLGLTNCDQVGAPSVVFAVQIDELSQLDVSAENAGGSVDVSLHKACVADEELGCDDGFFGPAELSARVEAGTYFVRVSSQAAQVSVSFDVRSLVRACNDGLDNDADGRIDLADAGCFGGTDDDETDPAVVPACADGIDNDADGATDAPADDACLFAGWNSEVQLCDLAPLAGAVGDAGGQVRTDTSSLGVDHYTDASCGDAGVAPEAVIALVLTAPSDVRATVTAADYDTLLFVRDACDNGMELDCNDDANGTRSEVELLGLAPGTYFFYVDGFNGNVGTAAVDFVVTPN